MQVRSGCIVKRERAMYEATCCLVCVGPVGVVCLFSTVARTVTRVRVCTRSHNVDTLGRALLDGVIVQGFSSSMSFQINMIYNHRMPVNCGLCHSLPWLPRMANVARAAQLRCSVDSSTVTHCMYPFRVLVR